MRTATFSDARNTSSDPVLLGPPILEFASLQRVPVGKRRNDARQGTIDQDPEFMEFLESLISPITKQVEPEIDTPRTKVTTTPLIQHLREKKAAKEAAKQKKEKEKITKQTGQTSKESVDKKVESDTAVARSKDAASTPAKKGGRPAKVEKAVKAVASPQKVMKKETVAAQTKPSIATAKPDTPAAPTVTNSTSVPTSTQQATSARRADINPAAAAARMLQRDLGTRGGRGGSLPRRGGRPTQDTTQALPSAAAPTATTPQPTKPAVATTNPVAVASPSNTPQPTTNTTVAKRNIPSQQPSQSPIARPTTATKPPVSTQPAQQATARPLPPMPSSGLGFLKHANPSQGITEPLLLTALSPFGTVIKVEIDKRKGFAYVEYAEPASLQKAIAASPIKVAQGAVQVQEKKDRGGAGGSMNGRANMPPIQAQMQPPRGPAAMGGAGRGNVPANVPGRQPQMFQPGRAVRGRGSGAGAHGGILHATHAPGVGANSAASPASAAPVAKSNAAPANDTAKASSAAPTQANASTQAAPPALGSMQADKSEIG